MRSLFLIFVCVHEHGNFSVAVGIVFALEHDVGRRLGGQGIACRHNECGSHVGSGRVKVDQQIRPGAAAAAAAAGARIVLVLLVRKLGSQNLIEFGGALHFNRLTLTLTLRPRRRCLVIVTTSLTTMQCLVRELSVEILIHKSFVE